MQLCRVLNSSAMALCDESLLRSQRLYRPSTRWMLSMSAGFQVGSMTN